MLVNLLMGSHLCLVLGFVMMVEKLVVDGAWNKDQLLGVAAWCGRANLNAFCSSIHALSLTGVEALAVFQALRWANVKGLRKIQILTDSFEVVKALCCIRNANVATRNVVLDILDIVSSFDYVNVTIKTTC